VRDATSAAAIAQGDEAVIVGSALVEKVRLSLDAAGKAAPATVVAAVTALVAELAAGVRNARQQAAE